MVIIIKVILVISIVLAQLVLSVAAVAILNDEAEISRIFQADE